MCKGDDDLASSKFVAFYARFDMHEVFIGFSSVFLSFQCICLAGVEQLGQTSVAWSGKP